MPHECSHLIQNLNNSYVSFAEGGSIFEINGAPRLDNFNLLSSDQSDAPFHG
jgi:hypothetical protein